MLRPGATLRTPLSTQRTDKITQPIHHENPANQIAKSTKINEQDSETRILSKVSIYKATEM